MQTTNEIAHDHDNRPSSDGLGHRLSRRGFVQTAVVAATAGISTKALADKPKDKGKSAEVPSFAAERPTGFVPLDMPGFIVRARGTNTLQTNQIWPLQKAADDLLAKAMSTLTGEPTVGKAFAKFVHPADRVAIKINGIAGQKGGLMATNKELVYAIVRGVLAAGVPAKQVWVMEQYPNYLRGARIDDKELPAGVTTISHNNLKAGTPKLKVHGLPTRFAKPLIDATAVINVSLIKDHSLCGYTGALKNMTHGNIMNPETFHANLMDPQIPLLYAQDAIRSRTRLHIIDAFKVMYDGGPLGRVRRAIVPFEQVFVSTDPVALDAVGASIVEKMRADHGVASFKELKREPTYIQRAAQLGIGIADLSKVRQVQVSV